MIKTTIVSNNKSMLLKDLSSALRVSSCFFRYSSLSYSSSCHSCSVAMISKTSSLFFKNKLRIVLHSLSRYQALLRKSKLSQHRKHLVPQYKLSPCSNQQSYNYLNANLSYFSGDVYRSWVQFNDGALIVLFLMKPVLIASSPSISSWVTQTTAQYL